jgi:hypothetical protein
MDIPISTDSAGFGRYLKSSVNLEGRGVKILSMGAGGAHASDELAEFLQHLYHSDAKTLAHYKEDAYLLMKRFDWKELSGNYARAYDLALEKKFGEKITLSAEGGEGRPAPVSHAAAPTTRLVRTLSSGSSRKKKAQASRPRK